MVDTAWVMRPGRRERRADVHQRRPDGGLDPLDLQVSQEPEFFMGGGGLYGTAADYRAFLQMILDHGKAEDGTQVLKPETVAMMGRNNIGDINVGTMVSVVPAASNDANFFPDMDQKWGLSFLINTKPGPHGRSAGSLSWAGLANSYYWVDPTTGVARHHDEPGAALRRSGRAAPLQRFRARGLRQRRLIRPSLALPPATARRNR